MELPFWGKTPDSMTPGLMTYHLRRLRLHGFIERFPKPHRYQVTVFGWKTALFCTRAYNRLWRPGLSQLIPSQADDESMLRRRFDPLDETINQWVQEQKLAA